MGTNFKSSLLLAFCTLLLVFSCKKSDDQITETTFQQEQLVENDEAAKSGSSLGEFDGACDVEVPYLIYVSTKDEPGSIVFTLLENTAIDYIFLNLEDITWNVSYVYSGILDISTSPDPVNNQYLGGSIVMDLVYGEYIINVSAEKGGLFMPDLSLSFCVNVQYDSITACMGSEAVQCDPADVSIASPNNNNFGLSLKDIGGGGGTSMIIMP